MKASKKIKAKGIVENPWHTDFRNTELLPDMKVVRTHFFINLVAVVLPFVILLYWVQAELKIASINSSISSLQKQVESKQDDDKEFLELSKKFDEETAKIKAMDEFFTNLFPGSDLLLELAELMEDNMSLSQFSLAEVDRKEGRRRTVKVWEGQMSGYVASESEGATAEVNRLAEKIREMDLFAPYISEPLEQVKIEVLSRDRATNSLNFTIRFSLNTPEKGKR